MDSEMLFRFCVDRAEDIICGIDKVLEKITDDEWANMEMGAICSNLREDRISFNRMIYREQLLSDSNYSLFKSDDEVMKAIEKIFNEIVIPNINNMDFAMLEKLFASILNMGYYARTYTKKNYKFNVNVILEKWNNDTEKKYLKLLSDIIYYKWLTWYQILNREDFHNINIMGLVDKAINIYPDGEVAYMYKEIEAINRFFKDSNDCNLERLEKTCFSEKGQQFLEHIMTYASSRAWDAYVPEHRFLPHINYEFGAMMSSTDIENIQYGEPKGYFAGQEQQFQEAYCSWHENSIKTLLSVPYIIRIEQSAGEIVYNLLTNFIENKEKNLQLEMLNNERKEVLDYYMHSWKHIAYPQIVNNVAEELLNNGHLSLGNKLKCAYDSEKTLKNGIELVQYIMSSDKEEVKNNFKKSFYLINAISGINILEIIEKSLRLVMFKIVMEESDNSTKIEQCRNTLKNNIQILRDSYVNTFINKDSINISIIQWFNENLVSLDISISDNWNEIRIKEDEFAYNQLIQVFVELFTNAIRHGNKEKGISLKLVSDEKVMKIEMTNYFNQDRKNGSQKGIATLKNIISKINMSDDIEGIKQKEENNKYSIVISFDKSLMYRKGRR